MISPRGRDDVPMSDTDKGRLALRVHMMPRDTNAYGTIFGGVILSLIDQAGFDEAKHHGVHRWVTVSFEGVEFQKPVYVGDVVSLYTDVVKFGTSSMQIDVTVYAERYDSIKTIQVTSGRLTMVSVGKDGRPIPFKSEPTLIVDRSNTQ